jgi:hypothetical protein
MRLTIEIIAALLLVLCISASTAALAAGRGGRSADGLSCTFSLPQNASPAARCAAIRRQCAMPITAVIRCWRICEPKERCCYLVALEQIKNNLASI